MPRGHANICRNRWMMIVNSARFAEWAQLRLGCMRGWNDMVWGACGWGFGPIWRHFSRFGCSRRLGAFFLPPGGFCRKWLRMDKMAWYEARIKSRDVYEVCGRGFGPIWRHFSRFGRSRHLRAFFRRRADFVGNGCEWMKWHGTRPGSSLGMSMEHLEGVLV